MIKFGKYLLNILVAFDQLLNVFLGGDPDETISSRTAKNMSIWYWRILGKILEFIDPGHLERVREDDEGKDSAWQRAKKREPP